MSGSGGFGDLGSLLRQAQKMQREMKRVQEELRERVVEGTAGGGAVKATVNGNKDVVAIKIQKEAVDLEDLGMLEDLIIAAVAAGMKRADEIQKAEMQKVTGGMNLPGLF
ncbi:MAG: YbaB/EbfC family nucleoid-associated protein [Planctomycetes bacterium]|nr:YbaB/EbfC family nucleoid-associated protein [Planctomycetota bacterium]